MNRIPLLIALLAVAGCVSSDRPVDHRRRYLAGYAARGPVEPSEHAYEDPEASIRFPSPAASRTVTVVDGVEEPPAGEQSSPPLPSVEVVPNEYRQNEYGGSGWIDPSCPFRPRPPRPQPR